MLLACSNNWDGPTYCQGYYEPVVQVYAVAIESQDAYECYLLEYNEELVTYSRRLEVIPQ